MAKAGNRKGNRTRTVKNGGSPSQKKPSSTEDLNAILTDLGQKGHLVFHVELPNHRVQSWNAILGMGLKARVAYKKKEKEQAMAAISSSS